MMPYTSRQETQDMESTCYWCAREERDPHMTEDTVAVWGVGAPGLCIEHEYTWECEGCLQGSNGQIYIAVTAHHRPIQMCQVCYIEWKEEHR